MLRHRDARTPMLSLHERKHAKLRGVMRLSIVLAATGFAIAVGMGAAPGTAQDYPYRPVRIIAPNPPGGGFDFVARVCAQRLTEQLGQQVVVENRTGAGTLVGTDIAAKSMPDGYTLLVGSLSNIAANPGLYKKLPYDPAADFVPVGMIVAYSYALVSRKDLPAQSLREIIDFARSNPGKLTYASGGVGTGQHVAAAVLAQLAGVQMVHVPYRGAQAAHLDLQSGRVDLFFDNAVTAKPYVDEGRLKVYAVSSAQRFPGLPGVPTVNETGVAKMEMDAWFGMFARAGTPAPVLQRLRAEMEKVIQAPDTVARFEKGGGRILRMSAAEGDAYVKSEIRKWTTLIRQAGIVAE
jgi:tripartite-type tricarboxylate transporter receptor subunit TctC